MTRKEEIQMQAEKKALEPSRLMHPYAKQHKVMSAYEIGFIEGAVWADSHPRWISVEDELPKEKGWILISSYSDVDMWYYDGQTAKDLMDYASITHWMPLPQPPKGGEK